MKVGDDVFVFDGNRRVYANRGAGGPPIYREHFSPVRIVGETRESWVLSDGWKHDKKTLAPRGEPFARGGLFTPQEVEDAVWAHEHRGKIEVCVRSCDVATLRKIADVLGMQQEASRG